MKRKKLFLILLVIFIIIIISSSINMVEAENLSDLQDKKNELQNQINESNEQIGQIQIELTENLEQLNNLNEKINGYEAEIDSLDNNLVDIEKQIESVTEKLDLIQENYDIQKNILQKRIVALYEVGDIVYLEVLLNSKSAFDFISNCVIIGEIARYDKELLEGIKDQKVQIETIKTSLEENKEKIKDIKKNKEKASIALENSKIIRNSYINKLSEEEKETQSKIDAFEDDLKKVEAQIIALTVVDLGEDYVGGELAWPAPGYTTITSNFGMRYHPIFKVYRSHSGTDIAMPTGAYIIAANDGIITTSLYSNSYGNMIIINHGGGLSTVYAHGSKILVQTGQEVKKGDIIMEAGSTGWSTGPHLHFEVRVNGRCIDPMPFITKQPKQNQVQENEGEE